MTLPVGEPPPPSGTVRIELRPRCSLSPAGARGLLLFSAAICLAAASAAAVYGAWPALVFAALELLLLRWALARSLERGADRELLELDEQQVRLTYARGTRRSGVSFARYWSHVRLQAAGSRLHPARLFLVCRHERCEIGSFLTESERLALAGRLKRLIGRSGEAPGLTFGGTEAGPHSRHEEPPQCLPT